MRKAMTHLLFPILILILIVSCGNPNSRDAQTDTAIVAQSDMWRVELISAEVSENLLTSITAVQYGGGSVTTENVVEPARGNVFLLLELNIEKTGTGRASFTWSDAHIEDAIDNKYYRHPNDTFLTHLNIPRIRGTDIMFGLEYGFVCFEIPADAYGLRFIADEGNIVIKVDP
jgi:hypothetical protein